MNFNSDFQLNKKRLSHLRRAVDGRYIAIFRAFASKALEKFLENENLEMFVVEKMQTRFRFAELIFFACFTDL